MVLSGASDTLAFEVYVREVLAPTLHKGQIVVLDNLSAHKSSRTAEALAARGCELWFLPSYSPDFSPIEQAFAKLKNQWRKAEARTPEALLDAVSSSLPSITSQDAYGFFQDCGFRVEAVQVQPI
jgi:transposase